jgi:hypothetical protein
MNPDEYLPPENDQAMTVPDASEVQTSEEFFRIQCETCSKEVGMAGKREHVFNLLEMAGWKVGRKIICPACVEKTARKFLKRYSENDL